MRDLKPKVSATLGGLYRGHLQKLPYRNFSGTRLQAAEPLLNNEPQLALLMNVPPSISCYSFGGFGNLYPHNSLYNPRYPLQTPLKISVHFVEGSHGCGQADPVRNVGVETSTPSKRCKRGNPFPLILNPIFPTYYSRPHHGSVQCYGSRGFNIRGRGRDG